MLTFLKGDSDNIKILSNIFQIDAYRTKLVDKIESSIKSHGRDVDKKIGIKIRACITTQVRI